jgi:hypothetical protein
LHAALRPNRPEYRWTERDARDQLTHNGRLANPLHGLTKKATDQKQQDDLRDEKCLRRPHVGFFRCGFDGQECRSATLQPGELTEGLAVDSKGADLHARPPASGHNLRLVKSADRIIGPIIRLGLEPISSPDVGVRAKPTKGY